MAPALPTSSPTDLPVIPTRLARFERRCLTACDRLTKSALLMSVGGVVALLIAGRLENRVPHSGTDGAAPAFPVASFPSIELVPSSAAMLSLIADTTAVHVCAHVMRDGRHIIVVNKEPVSVSQFRDMFDGKPSPGTSITSGMPPRE